VAETEGLDIANSAVRGIVVAGEPGGNIPATRSRIEGAWGARVFDHYGLTEVGPVASEFVATAPGDPAQGRGQLYLLECAYLAEVIDQATGAPVAPGAYGELVLTNLNRLGSPLIRYRTGDTVRLATDHDSTGRTWRRLDGGILGRVDDMIHVRGNNLYPSAIEAIVRRFADIAEYRVHVDRAGPLADVRLEIEPVRGAGAAVAEAVVRAVRNELLFRIEVTVVPPGSLPRFEMKARRLIRAEGKR
jgi:phenylacetate-CoA ligase